MGDGCKVQNYALVYEPAVLEDGVFVGPSVVFTNDHFPRAINIDGSVKSAHDWEPVGVTVRHGASIGARAVCVAPVVIGRWATVAAGAWSPRMFLTTRSWSACPHDASAGWGRLAPRSTKESETTFRCPVTDSLYDENERRARTALTHATPTLKEELMNQPTIPAASPIIGDEERAAVDRVMRSGMIAQGPEVAAFEREFADELVGGRTCVAVNSGTSGLHLGLLAAGIGPGDEVLVPSFTFAATGNSVALTGATPVFVDIDPDTFCMDPDCRRGRRSPTAPPRSCPCTCTVTPQT